MTTRYLIREKRGDIITPRPDLGVFFGLRLARTTAKRLGYPPKLIKKVSKHANENA